MSDNIRTMLDRLRENSRPEDHVEAVSQIGRVISSSFDALERIAALAKDDRWTQRHRLKEIGYLAQSALAQIKGNL